MQVRPTYTMNPLSYHNQSEYIAHTLLGAKQILYLSLTLDNVAVVITLLTMKELLFFVLLCVFALREYLSSTTVYFTLNIDFLKNLMLSDN